MQDELISLIARQLNIPQGKETYNEWMQRVIYSAAGRMALASLWDFQDNEDTISIQYFKKKVDRILASFWHVYSSDRSHNARSGLIDEIYTIYLRAGYLFHSPHRIASSMLVEVCAGDVMFCRGFFPDNDSYMSGLGLYKLKKENTSSMTLADMYGLPEQHMSLYLDDVISEGKWVDIEWPESSRFLEKENFSLGYWKEKPDEDGEISMAYYGDKRRTYILYRYENGIAWGIQLHPWRLVDFASDNPDDFGEYRRIANAVLINNGSRPDIQAWIDRELVLVDVGYRLPPAEEDFLKLYSWPLFNDIDQLEKHVFRRKMAKPVYSIFKQFLESVGYCFTEK